MRNKSGRKSAIPAFAKYLFISLGLFILYFVGMGSYPLVDPDEPVYGQFAKEMALGGSWLTPHYNGHIWFDKPPLFYWLSAACMSILHPSELTSRLPSAMLAVGVVLLLYALATHDFGRKAGILSALVMATCLQQIILARAAVTDMTLLFCLLGALYSYRRWLDADNHARLGWMALCGAMTGLGMLTKGPVAPLLLFVTFCIHLWITGRLSRLLSVDAVVGIIMALAVGLPWYLAMYTLHRHAFIEQFIMANNITRYVKPEHSGTTGNWYSYFLNIPVLFIFFFPWSVFLIQSVIRHYKTNDGAKLAAIWFGVVFVFFSVSKTQLVTYIFPLYPAAALFVGALLNSAASGDDRSSRIVNRALNIAIAAAVLFTIALLMVAKDKYPEARIPALIMGLTLVVAFIAARVWTRRFIRYGNSGAAWIIGTGMTLFALELVLGLVPILSPGISTREIVRCIPRASREHVVALNLNLVKRQPSLFFYLGCLPENLTDITTAKQLLSAAKPVIIVCRDKEAAQLYSPGSTRLIKRGGLALVENKETGLGKGYSNK